MSAAGLTLRKSCGETFCDPYYMCSAHDLRCYPCHNYCDDASNNFDANICEQQCQDYIHDYMKHYANTEKIQDVLNEFHNLKSLMICMILLMAVALVFITVTLVFIWKREKRIRKIKSSCQDSFFKKKLASLQYLKKKDQPAQQPAVATVSETVDNKTAATCTQTDLTAVAMASASSSASSSASASSSGQRTNISSAGGTSTSGSSNSNKLPCEDATLEFVGYDNFALKVSPLLPGKTTIAAVTSADRGPPAHHQLQFTP